jgi:hypothetical protein
MKNQLLDLLSEIYDEYYQENLVEEISCETYEAHGFPCQHKVVDGNYDEAHEEAISATKDLVQECLNEFLADKKVNEFVEICKKAKQTIKNL